LKHNTAIRELKIESAAASRAQLLELLKNGKAPAIDLSSLETIDLSGIQELVALLREASSANRETHLTGALGAEVQRAIVLSGLCDRECATAEELERAIRSSL
jgi:anti-anti-sigma regulatory factor